MKQHITLEIAHRLFEEARDFMSGRVPFIKDDSDIRHISQEVFGKSFTMHMKEVCNEIFYVLACEAKGVER